MNLDSIFEEVSKQMQGDFEKAREALSHAGLKGGANEETVRMFLRQYLPMTLELSTGVVVDSTGRTSRQIDIIVHDAAKTPIFYQSGHSRVVPVECVYAAFEVKAYLDKGELLKAYENMMSLKTLTKVAFFKRRGPIIETKTLYGQEWDHWPIQHFVFAFDSPSLDSVVQNLAELNVRSAVHQRIDAICVLGKGVIVNRTKSGLFQATPEEGSDLVASSTTKPLLLFYALVSIVLNQANMDPFNIHPYLSNIRF